MSNEFKVSDRVKRADATGSYGVITEIREELTPARVSPEDKPLLCKVRWDDGIHSYYDLKKLQKAND